MVRFKSAFVFSLLFFAIGKSYSFRPIYWNYLSFSRGNNFDLHGNNYGLWSIDYMRYRANCTSSRFKTVGAFFAPQGRDQYYVGIRAATPPLFLPFPRRKIYLGAQLSDQFRLKTHYFSASPIIGYQWFSMWNIGLGATVNVYYGYQFFFQKKAAELFHPSVLGVSLGFNIRTEKRPKYYY
jgi:hypothetical protein